METQRRPPLVAITGRRLGNTKRWPYARAAALPRGYLDAVTRAGGLPVLADPVGDLRPLLDRVDALVLSGGADLDPETYGEVCHESVYGVDRAADDTELALVDAAVERALPVLAICRGSQLVNVARGGTLHQHLPDLPGIDAHGRPGEPDGGWRHEIDIAPESLLAEVLGASRVTGSCHHHQAVAKLGDGLRVVATSPDGVVEGLELDGAWLLAVQWHPEDTAESDPLQQRLFDALVAHARH
jgi:gamma-glutamyl-gamma-aminobutyrate hydrolase PuuD